MDSIVETITFVDGNSSVELCTTKYLQMTPLVNLFRFTSNNTNITIELSLLTTHLFGEKIKYTLKDMTTIVNVLSGKETLCVNQKDATSQVDNPNLYKLIHFIDVYSDCFESNSSPLISEDKSLTSSIEVIQKYISFACGHTNVFFADSRGLYDNMLSHCESNIIPIQLLTIKCNLYEFAIMLNAGAQGINIWNFNCQFLYTKDECNRRTWLHSSQWSKEEFNLLKSLWYCDMSLTNEFATLNELSDHFNPSRYEEGYFNKAWDRMYTPCTKCEKLNINSGDERDYPKEQCCGLEYSMEIRKERYEKHGLCACYDANLLCNHEKTLPSEKTVDISTQDGVKYISEVHMSMIRPFEYYRSKSIGFETLLSEEVFISFKAILPTIIQENYSIKTMPIVASNTIQIAVGIYGDKIMKDIDFRVHLGFVRI